MKSMTGYAYREITKGAVTASAEIKCYNNRFLDISVYLPSWLSSFELRIRKHVSERINRGKVDVGIKIKEDDPRIVVTINNNAAYVYDKAIRGLAKMLKLKDEPRLGLILGSEGVLETETERDIENYWKLIEPVIIDAVEQVDTERIREGEHTKADIITHISLIEDSMKLISANVPELEASLKENLKTRIEEYLGDKIDENRILAETAVLLVKYSISEELSRLSSHLSEFRLEMERNPSPGKKLDFLSQEINREINTIGSKTPVLEVSRAVVEMKNSLENIREQLRNVE